MPILEGLSVSRRFGGLTAVCDVDFHLNEQEILGLIGPNGAGKSTLFNLISAALTPKPGKILFKGVDITGIKPNRICRMGLARTFQNVKIFSNLSVLENVLIGSFFGSSTKVSPSQARHYAEEALAFTGLSAAKDSLAADLTLANQKRLEVARALATKPQVIMLDEIMEGLNPSEVSQAMDLVDPHSGQRGCRDHDRTCHESHYDMCPTASWFSITASKSPMELRRKLRQTKTS